MFIVIFDNSMNFSCEDTCYSLLHCMKLSLYKSKRTIQSRGKQDIRWKLHHLVLYCFCGILAGVVGGFLGLGGGFILGPLFLELGNPSQVASATSTFALAFSSSMSVVWYYLLDRFPILCATYFVIVAIVAAFTSQQIVRTLIVMLGRGSLIIFILGIIDHLYSCNYHFHKCNHFRWSWYRPYR